ALRLTPVLGPNSIDTVEAVGEPALESRFGRGCSLQRFGNFFLGMSFEAHLKGNLLLVFVNDGDGQTEADDNEIDGRAACGEWRDPSALATALISDPSATLARD